MAIFLKKLVPDLSYTTGRRIEVLTAAILEGRGSTARAVFMEQIEVDRPGDCHLHIGFRFHDEYLPDCPRPCRTVPGSNCAPIRLAMARRAVRQGSNENLFLKHLLFTPNPAEWKRSEGSRSARWPEGARSDQR